MGWDGKGLGVNFIRGTKLSYKVVALHIYQAVMIRGKPAARLGFDGQTGQPFCCRNRLIPCRARCPSARLLVIFRRLDRRSDPSSAVAVDLFWYSLRRRPIRSAYVLLCTQQ